MIKLLTILFLLISLSSFSQRQVDYIEITIHVRDCEDKRIEYVRYEKAKVENGQAIWNDKHYGIRQLLKLLKEQGYTSRVILKSI